MKKITPYLNSKQALSSLDNGGRFYNFFTEAKDGVIATSELGKVGGIFANKQKMILFLELSLQALRPSEKESIISKLDEKLKDAYHTYKPQELLPSEAQSKGIIASNAILTGVPKLVTSKSEFSGFIMVPIITGSVTTFTMIPIIDQYDVYELRDETTSETFVIAHAKGSEKLPAKKLKVAGVLKELKDNEKEKTASKKFLEAVYHTDLS